MLPGRAPSGDDADDRTPDLLDLLRHDLKGPLTVIRGQTQLLLRRSARLEGLDETERAWLLERGARIDAAIMAMAARIEQLGRESQAAEDAREQRSEQGR